VRTHYTSHHSEGSTRIHPRELFGKLQCEVRGAYNVKILKQTMNERFVKEQAMALYDGEQESKR